MNGKAIVCMYSSSPFLQICNDDMHIYINDFHLSIDKNLKSFYPKVTCEGRPGGSVT